MDALPRRRWCGSSWTCAIRCARCPALVCRRLVSDALCVPDPARQDAGAQPAAPAATAPTPGGGADQRASIQADIERQREERLAAKQQGGGGAARQAWGAAPVPGRDAAVVAKSYCSAVSAHHRDGRSAFDAYDTSRSGVISFEDLRRGVRSERLIV